MTRIEVGDRVRAFDYPGRSSADYVEGDVVAIGYPFSVQNQLRYYVLVQREVAHGQERTPTRRFFYPPVNGTRTRFGGVHCGVFRIAG